MDTGVGSLVAALGGVGGAPPRPGVLHVVAVPRHTPAATSVRAAVVLAGADRVRVAPELPPDVLRPLWAAPSEVAGIATLTPADVPADAVLVQLVATAVQTSPVLLAEVARLRDGGVEVELVASTGEVEAALVAGGVGVGVAREPQDGRLDVAVLAHDRPDPAAWRTGLTLRGYLLHTPCVLLEAAGTPHQTASVLTVKDLGERELRGPVVLAVGDDVQPPVPWADDLPLRGRTVANLRAPHQASTLSSRLRSLGAAVVETPLLGIAEGDRVALDDAVGRLAQGTVAAVCLTSPNGVRAVAASLARRGEDARVLAAVGTVACVGPGTAAALWDELRVRADLVADVHTTAGLADALGAPPEAGATALLPRADLATDELRDRLRAAGWATLEVDAYRTVPVRPSDAALDALAGGVVDLVPVLSSSMARQLVEVGRERGVQAAIVSIGPVTTATLRELGVEPATEADPHDLDGLVAALVATARRLPR